MLCFNSEAKLYPFPIKIKDLCFAASLLRLAEEYLLLTVNGKGLAIQMLLTYRISKGKHREI